MNALFAERCNIVPLIMPVNLATGANTGDFVCMKNYDRMTIVFLAGVGAAAQDPTLTVLQATSDGGSTKALDFTRLDVKQASALTSVGTYTAVTQAAGNTYTEATSGEKQKLWQVDITGDMLDRDNGYDWVQVTIADTGSTSQIGCVFAIMGDTRYAGPLLTAIA